jgi:nucleoside phosphorylase
VGVLQGRRGHARVVVLTIIEEEFLAAQTALCAHGEVGVTGVFTTEALAANPERRYPFVLTQSSDRGNTPAAQEITRLLELYRPEVVLLVGIAGGIQRADGPVTKGPGIGDVVVGKYVHYAPFTKNLPAGRFLRYIPLDQPSSGLVSQHADVLARPSFPDCWAGLSEHRPGETGSPRVHVGEIIAIESIAGNPSGEEQIFMLERFDNADAVDMESMGVGRAIHEYREDVHYSPRWLCIRGISDIVTAESPPLPVDEDYEEGGTVEAGDNNVERQLWKRYASAAAATFARRVVERLLTEARPPCPPDAGADSWLFEQLARRPHENGMSDGAGML